MMADECHAKQIGDDELMGLTDEPSTVKSRASEGAMNKA